MKVPNSERKAQHSVLRVAIYRQPIIPIIAYVFNFETGQNHWELSKIIGNYWNYYLTAAKLPINTSLGSNSARLVQAPPLNQTPQASSNVIILRTIYSLQAPNYANCTPCIDIPNVMNRKRRKSYWHFFSSLVPKSPWNSLN